MTANALRLFLLFIGENVKGFGVFGLKPGLVLIFMAEFALICADILRPSLFISSPHGSRYYQKQHGRKQQPYGEFTYVVISDNEYFSLIPLILDDESSQLQQLYCSSPP